MDFLFLLLSPSWYTWADAVSKHHPAHWPRAQSLIILSGPDLSAIVSRQPCPVSPRSPSFCSLFCLLQSTLNFLILTSESFQGLSRFIISSLSPSRSCLITHFVAAWILRAERQSERGEEVAACAGWMDNGSEKKGMEFCLQTIDSHNLQGFIEDEISLISLIQHCDYCSPQNATLASRTFFFFFFFPFLE